MTILWGQRALALQMASHVRIPSSSRNQPWAPLNVEGVKKTNKLFSSVTKSFCYNPAWNTSLLQWFLYLPGRSWEWVQQNYRGEHTGKWVRKEQGSDRTSLEATDLEELKLRKNVEDEKQERAGTGDHWPGKTGEDSRNEKLLGTKVQGRPRGHWRVDWDRVVIPWVLVLFGDHTRSATSIRGKHPTRCSFHPERWCVLNTQGKVQKKKAEGSRFRQGRSAKSDEWYKGKKRKASLTWNSQWTFSTWTI